MAELSKIRKNGVDYDIKDSTARADIEELKNKNYLTEVPDGYAKTEDIPTDSHINDLINTALGVIENGSY